MKCVTYTDLVVLTFFFVASMATRLFADESKSLRSFHVNSHPLPSLKASSLKLPSPLPFHHRAQEPTIQDLISGKDIMGLPPMYVHFLIVILNLTLRLVLLQSQKHQ